MWKRGGGGEEKGNERENKGRCLKKEEFKFREVEGKSGMSGNVKVGGKCEKERKCAGRKGMGRKSVEKGGGNGWGRRGNERKN